MRLTLEVVKELRIINNPSELERARWENFVKTHPQGNFFQSPGAYDFFNGVKGFEPHVIFATRDDDIIGILLAVLIRGNGPKGYFSRRCVIWGGPLVLQDHIEVTALLLERLNRDIPKISIFTEFRNLFNTEHLSKYFYKSGFVFEEEVNYIVKVNQSFNPLNNIKESKRRQIKKSLKNGAGVIEAANPEQVRAFHDILSNLYKEKIKKPLPGIQFFVRFFNMKNLGRIFLVMYEDRVVGRIVCPIYKETIFEWYICGLDTEYDNIHPSVLATWAPVYYAYKEGLKYFDFMGAGKPDEYYGVRRFKSQFGGDDVQFGRYKRINQKFMYKIGETALALNQILT